VANTKIGEIGPDDEVVEEGNGGLGTRKKARENGVASILAWGETRGRYLDE
jgi:hypothetical protein